MYTLLQTVKDMLAAEDELYQKIGEANMLIWQIAVDFADWPGTDFLHILGISLADIQKLSVLPENHFRNMAYNGIPLFKLRIDDNLAINIATRSGTDKLLNSLKEVIIDELHLGSYNDISTIIDGITNSQKKRIEEMNKAVWQIVQHLRIYNDPIATERLQMEKKHLDALFLVTEYEFHVLTTSNIPIFRINVIVDDMIPSRRKEKKYKPMDHLLLMIGQSIYGD